MKRVPSRLKGTFSEASDFRCTCGTHLVRRVLEAEELSVCTAGPFETVNTGGQDQRVAESHVLKKTEGQRARRCCVRLDLQARSLQRLSALRPLLKRRRPCPQDLGVPRGMRYYTLNTVCRSQHPATPDTLNGLEM